ncbi:MAG: hypothetical protein ACTHLD_19810 [Chitinophaga sp.]
MNNKELQQIVSHANLCDDFYIDAQALYLQTYRKMPSVSSIYQVDFRKAFNWVKENRAEWIEDIYTYRDYDRSDKKYTADRMIVVLKDVPVMLVFAADYVEILHGENDLALVDELTAGFQSFRQRQKRKAQEITGPSFIELLISYPNSVLVIEDAENVLADRAQTENSSVSNLLNLSDGLLADCLNVQVVCTFNGVLSRIDKALLRKGRLIAQYEFKELSAPQAQRLSAHLGFDTVINRPMSIAEIANQHKRNFDVKQVQVGFRAALQS